MTQRLTSKEEMRSATEAARCAGKRVGLVPTMGALHDGHLALVRAARERCDVVAVSIFVNPTQFGPGEDFERYPRDLDADSALLSGEGVDLIFAPTTAEMYGDGALVTVDPGPLATRWEGEVRPGHFTGMATIVAKLLNVVRPDAASFGEKDFQQLAIVRRMANDLDLGAEIVGVPTVRAADGLALSSRNAYLAASEREHALALPAALAAAAEALAAGERSGRELEAVMRGTVASASAGAIALDYAAVVDPLTLEPLDTIDREARALIAGRLGTTRLIDNQALIPHT